MKENKTIELTVKNDLCTGCGTCIAFCPTSAIQIVKNKSKGIYTPEIDYKKCNKCGICHQICPGHSVDFKQLNQAIFGKEPNDILIGNYLNCYIGHAIDYKIQYNSSSGGLITTLLIFALEKGLIDGALVTKMSLKNPLEPEPFIARTREEIISASKSKYCPVPANIALKEILKSKANKKFAVVGLPCHIQGIRKAEIINKELKRKVVLHLGLFCSHTPNFWGTELLFKRIKVNKEEVTKLDYRGEGWPGSMKISLMGKTKTLSNYWNFLGSGFFIPTRCLVCNDQTSELADISFGDPWRLEVSNKIGKSIAISRTAFGEQLIQRAQSENSLELRQVTDKEVKLSQLGMLYFKKKNLRARIDLSRRKVSFNANLLEPNFTDCLLSLFSYLNHLTSQNCTLRLALRFVPQKLLSLYTKSFNIVYYKRVRIFGDRILKDNSQNESTH